MKSFNFKAIAVAAGIGAAFFAAAPAHAYTYALSHLDISNLTLVTTQGSAAVNSFTFNLTNTATLNGVSTIQTATCNSGGNPCNANPSLPVLDAAPANAPGSAPIRANNNFSFIGFGGNTPFSNSDSVINTAAVVQGIPTSTQQIAESLLIGSGTAAASTLVQSNTTLAFQIAVGQTGANLALSFMADPDLEARISNLSNGSFSSQADVQATFTLRNNATGQFVTWAPTGTAANDCFTNLAGVTCTETADTQNLNTNVGTGTNNTDVTSSFDVAQTLTAFGINIVGLSAGTYSLTLAAQTSTSIFQTLPEPGTTALVGLALAGLSFTGKRRSRANNA